MAHEETTEHPVLYGVRVLPLCVYSCTVLEYPYIQVIHVYVPIFYCV